MPALRSRTRGQRGVWGQAKAYEDSAARLKGTTEKERVTQNYAAQLAKLRQTAKYNEAQTSLTAANLGTAQATSGMMGALSVLAQQGNIKPAQAGALAQAFKGGGGSGLVKAISNTTGIKDLGRLLESRGYLVGEHPAFGGVNPVHTSGSLHDAALAFDVNSGGNERKRLNKLFRALAKALGPQIIDEAFFRNMFFGAGETSVPNHESHLHAGFLRKRW